MSTLIQTIDSLEEAITYFKEATPETLLILDVDMVLTLPQEPAFQLPNLFHFKEVIHKALLPLTPEVRDLVANLMIIDGPSLLVNPGWPEAIKKLQEANIPVIGLTAIFPGTIDTIFSMEEWRYNTLKKLQIDFTLTAPWKEDHVFENLPSYFNRKPTYSKGILYSNGENGSIGKGEVLVSFLELLSWQPKKVFVLDDKLFNLKDIERFLPPSITFQGLHDLEAFRFPSPSLPLSYFTSQIERMVAKAQALGQG